MNPCRCWIAAASLVAVSGAMAGDVLPLRVHRLPIASPGVTAAAPFVRPSATIMADILVKQLTREAPFVGASASLSKVTGADRTAKDAAGALRSGFGTPLQLLGDGHGGPTMAAAARAVDDVKVAREFLRRNAGALHLADPDQELVLERQERDELGRRHLRFEQKYAGIAVWPSELTVHLDAAGSVDLLDGNFIGTPRRVPSRPIIEGDDAMERAARAAGTDRAACGIPQLIVYTAQGRYPRLAWRINVAPTLLATSWMIVDASNGAILDRISRVMDQAVTGSGVDLKGTTRTLHVWQSGGSVFMIDTSKPMYDTSSQPPDLKKTRGAIVILDAANQPPNDHPQTFPSVNLTSSNSANSWSIPATVSAAWWLSATYDYYLHTFNRNSIDGQRGTISGVTRFGSGMHNAFWLSEQGIMVFGDGDFYAAGTDVIGHEMTHGVTANTSALIYKDQAGALNESISDIFGEMVENDALGSNDWIMGTTLTTPIRSMKDPGRFGDPAKMSDFVHTTNDHGGVHTNSGIINKAFYLLAEGLNGGIGKRDAAAIFFRALTMHFTKDSQFIDARLATIASARELFGAGSRQATMTADAFDAVEVFDASAPPQAPPIPTVSGNDATLFVFFDSSAGRYFLGRKELPSDGNGGAGLSHFDVSERRPAVTGDGTLAAFVDSVDDACLIATDGSQAESCLNLPSNGIRVSSVGMSRDARRFGFVLLGSDGFPENQILVVDLQTKQTVTYQLTSSTLDGGALATILFADAMTFTSDGRAIVFDAFNKLTLSDGSAIGAWSIGALDLSSGTTLSLVPPDAQFDIDFPDLGRTSDDLLTFELRDSVTGDVIIAAANLDRGEVKTIGRTNGVLAVPSYTGDDRGIVYSVAAATPTKTSLFVQALGTDSITPVGSPSIWLQDGGNATIYRRGTFAGPSTNPGRVGFASGTFAGNAGATATITVSRLVGNQGPVSVAYRTVDGSAVAGRDYTAASGTLTWNDGDGNAKSFQVRLSSQATASSLTLALSSPSGGVQIDSGSATLTIAGSTNPPPPTNGRRRSVRH
jgi:bacillolysin